MLTTVIIPLGYIIQDHNVIIGKTKPQHLTHSSTMTTRPAYEAQVNNGERLETDEEFSEIMQHTFLTSMGRCWMTY